MQPRIILDSAKFSLTIDRLCHQLIENHSDFTKTALVGVQPRGVFLADRIVKRLTKITGKKILYGKLDVTFYRDDFRRSDKLHTPQDMDMPFVVEGKNIVLIDDVLYTGRTIRAALDALLDFGRPNDVELLVLVDRRFTRELPIQPDYVGKTIDSLVSETVKVDWKEIDGEDRIWMETPNEKKV